MSDEYVTLKMGNPDGSDVVSSYKQFIILNSLNDTVLRSYGDVGIYGNTLYYFTDRWVALANNSDKVDIIDFQHSHRHLTDRVEMVNSNHHMVSNDLYKKLMAFKQKNRYLLLVCILNTLISLGTLAYVI